MTDCDTVMVTPECGPAPAGNPGMCFYCRRAIGDEHMADCVLRRRSVVLRMTIEFPVWQTESWTPEMIVQHRMSTGWCAGNVVRELDRLGCLCGVAAFEFVREGRDADHEWLKAEDAIVVDKRGS